MGGRLLKPSPILTVGRERENKAERCVFVSKYKERIEKKNPSYQHPATQDPVFSVLLDARFKVHSALRLHLHWLIERAPNHTAARARLFCIKTHN